MSQGGLVQMADILPPLLPGDADSVVVMPLALALIVVALIVAWRWWRHPLRRLARELARDRLSPRAAAHRLAPRLVVESELRRELDRSRFQRQPPSTAAVSELIRRAADGR
ncbi:MAG: hypothetical protein KDI82_11575 [Gammaproteobacteria bacterium]|nr:hypothetical protein [Gammaproteobacteria bacterium]